MSTREKILAQVEKDAQLNDNFVLLVILSAIVAGIGLLENNLAVIVGATLLLAVNVVCINLSAKLVFLFRGIKPRTWLEAHKAKQSRLLYIGIWVVLLALLFIVIYLRHKTQA